MSMNSVLLSKEDFSNLLNGLLNDQKIDHDFLYDVYKMSIEGLEQITQIDAFSQLAGNSISNFEVVNYLIGEYLYSTFGRDEEQLEKFKLDENIKTSMASVVADKYFSLSKLSHKERRLTNKFFPPMSSLNLYLNFMLNIVGNYEKNDPASTLVTDLLFKALSISKSILDLLMGGFETQAFSCWRTLHECECTLVILSNYGEPAIKSYLKHMNYGLAFKDSIKNKEEQDKIFYSMKDEMKEYDLKSKDIKKYIEYGWLYNVGQVKEDKEFKLNFRDGLEKVAELSEYNQRYESSSEIIHSTPLLIYSNKEYFYFITLLSTYESFFRIEKVFENLFANRVSAEVFASYQKMKSVYYAQLVNIHKRESMNFKGWLNKKR